MKYLLQKLMWPKRYFVGMLTLEVVGSRIFWPPFRLDWQGSVGPFTTECEAKEFVSHIKNPPGAEGQD